MGRRNLVRGVSNESFQKALAESQTWTEVLVRLGLNPSGGKHKTVKQRAQEEGLPYKHIEDSSKRKMLNGLIRSAKPLSEVMVAGSSYNRCHLKKRLLDEGLLSNECAICGMPPSWKGKPLVMVLDHINGVPNDHRLENLRLVCPNCNSQLPTFAAKKNKKPPKRCKDCGKLIHKGSIRCRSCSAKFRHSQGSSSTGRVPPSEGGS